MGAGRLSLIILKPSTWKATKFMSASASKSGTKVTYFEPGVIEELPSSWSLLRIHQQHLLDQVLGFG
jgi:hypothetical protein